MCGCVYEEYVWLVPCLFLFGYLVVYLSVCLVGLFCFAMGSVGLFL